VRETPTRNRKIKATARVNHHRNPDERLKENIPK
jgi:hypothetical protein